MKRLIKIATITLALGTSLMFASSTKEFKLLNDMHLAAKQQHLLWDIKEALKTNHVDIEASKQFTQVLLGLIKGDKSLNLKGTNIPKIKVKLEEIEKLWKKELLLLSSAKSNKDTQKAIEMLDTMMIKMNETVLIYDESYSRFRQKIKFSSIVESHSIINNIQLYALK